MQTATCSFRGTFVNHTTCFKFCVAIARSNATGGTARVLTYSYMVQSEVTSTIVAGVCDPGIPTTTGLREAGYNAGPIAARAEAPEFYPKTGVLNHARIRARSGAGGRKRSLWNSFRYPAKTISGLPVQLPIPKPQ
jgi:hypothetical protein